MTFDKIKNFVDSLYDYEYSGVNDKENSDEEEAAIVTETDQSKLVSYTDSSSEEEDLHVDVNFDEPIDLIINWFSVFLKKIEFQRNK